MSFFFLFLTALLIQTTRPTCYFRPYKQFWRNFFFWFCLPIRSAIRARNLALSRMCTNSPCVCGGTNKRRRNSLSSSKIAVQQSTCTTSSSETVYYTTDFSGITEKLASLSAFTSAVLQELITTVGIERPQTTI